MRLAALHLYPVKSLRGFPVQSAEIDSLGAVGDRRFLVIDAKGEFMTQRTVPRMALVQTSLDAGSLVLFLEGHGRCAVARGSDPAAPLVTVRVWKSEGLRAEDCGDAPAQWLGAALREPCRLVRIGNAFERPVLKAARPGDRVTFADAYPFLATSEASLDDLNQRIAQVGGEPVPMDRFRPNLVLEGCGAYAEDSWKRFRIGNIVFRAAGCCARCSVTITDQTSGERDVEPLRTLASYRRDPADPIHVNFGQNLVHEDKAGILRVGDPVEVLE